MEEESKRALSFCFALAGQLPTQSKHISGAPCAESSRPRTGKQAKAVPDTQKERHSNKEASRPCLKPSTQAHTQQGQVPALRSGDHTSPLFWDISRHRHIQNSSKCVCLSRSKPSLGQPALKELEPSGNWCPTLRASSRVLETFLLGVWFGSHVGEHCMLR